MVYLQIYKRTFFSKTLNSHLRIGPHKKELIDTIVGSILGNGSWGEKRRDAVRFHFHYSSKNVEYLEYLQQFFAQNGYCSSVKVKKTIQIGKSGKVYHSIKLRTYSFKSFQFIYDTFYGIDKKKRIPKHISNWLNARALAIWIMNDGGINGQFFKLFAESSFTNQQVELLKKALLKNFDCDFTLLPRRRQHKVEWILYLSKKQLPLLAKSVKPFMLPCMYYKISSI